MTVVGVVLLVIGFVIFFAGGLGLKFNRAARDESDDPVDPAVDALFFGGLISTLGEFFRTAGEGPRSPLLPVVVLMTCGAAMLATGAILLWMSSP